MDLPAGITLSSDGGVRTVTLDRPGLGNAIDAGMHEALSELWGDLSADDEARCIVLTGGGRVFCAGGDLLWIDGMLHEPAVQQRAITQDQRILTAMRSCPLPIIAAINGPAVGLGCSIALMCDLVLMAKTAYIADPHVSIGLVAGDGGAAALPMLIPFMRAKQFLYTGDPISAELAVELGLAITAVEPDALQDETLALAHRIASQPVAALRDTKRAVNMHLERAMAEVASFASVAELETLRSPAVIEAVSGFADKERQRRGLI
jgi:enoyl-CoA hydratase